MAVALGQSTIKIETGVATSALAFTSNVTSGRLLLVSVSSWNINNPSPLTISDSRGFTWAPVHSMAEQTSGDLSQILRTWWAIASSSGACTVTIGSGEATADFTFTVSEWTGVDEADPFTLSAVATGSGSSTAPATGTIDPDTDPGMLYAAVTHLGATETLTQNGAWTLLGENEAGANSAVINVCYRTLASGTTTASWTVGSSVEWFCHGFGIKEASAGTTATAGVIAATSSVKAPGVSAVSGSGPAAFKATVESAAQNKTSGSTLAFSPDSTIAVGDLLVICMACDTLSNATPTATCADNSASAGTANVYSVSKAQSTSNTAAASAVGQFIYCLVTREIATTDTVTVTLSGAVAAKALVAQTFSGISGIRGTPATLGGLSTTASVANTNPVAGDLIVAMVAAETFTAPTADADTTNGSWSTALQLATSGSSGQTNVIVSTQYKVVTATGTQTFNSTTVNTDWGCISVAFAPLSGAVNVTPATVVATSAVSTPTPVIPAAAHTLVVTLSSTWFTSTTPKTATVSWAAGETVVVAAAIESNDDALSTPTAPGLTFSLLTSVTAGGAAESGAYIWSAMAQAAGTTQDITLARTGSAGAKYGFSVSVVSGGSASVGNVLANQTESALSLTVGTGSSVIYVAGDQNQTALAETWTTGSGTQTGRGRNQDATWGFFTGDWRGTAAGTFTFGPGAYTGMKVAQAAVEIKAATATLTVAPAVVASDRSVSAATPTATAAVVPAVVAANRSVGAPVVSTAVTVTATAITGTGAVGAPVAIITATPTVIAATGDVPLPGVSTAADQTIIATVVTATGSVSALTPSSTATATATEITATSAIPVPAAVVLVAADATTIAATSTVEAPSFTTTATPTPAVVAATSAVEAPTISATATVTATAAARTSTVQQPSILTGGGGGGSAPTIRATPTLENVTSGSTTHTVTRPPGTTDGDLLITLFGTDLSTNSIDTPTGWTRLSQLLPADVCGAVDWKIAASEPATTDWTITTTERAAWIAMAISGAGSTFDVTASTTAEPANSMDFPTVTTTVDNCLVLYLAVIDFGNAVTFASAPTGTTLIGLSEVTSGARMIGWYEVQATAGLTTQRQAVGSANETTGLWTIAIPPAGGGASSATAAVVSIVSVGAVGLPVPTASATPVPAAVAATSAVLLPTALGDAGTTATPTAITATGVVAAPTPSITASPTVIAATSAVASPTATATATVATAVVAATGVVPLPTPTASASLTAVVVAGTGTVPALTPYATATVAAVAYASASSVPAALVSTTSTPTLTAIAAASAVGVPAVMASSTPVAVVVASASTVNGPVVSTAVTATASTVTSAGAVQAPTVSATATASPAVFAAGSSIRIPDATPPSFVGPVDTFPGTTLNAHFNPVGTVSVADGSAKFTMQTGGASRIYTAAGLSLIGKQLVVETWWDTDPAPTTNFPEVYLLFITAVGEDPAFSTYQNDLLIFGGPGADPSVTYNPTAHRWWRIRELDGTVYWDTAPDGITWTNRRTEPTSAFTLTSGYIEFGALRQAGTATFAYLDNFNSPPVAGPISVTPTVIASTSAVGAPAVSSAVTVTASVVAADHAISAATVTTTAAAALSAVAATSTVPLPGASSDVAAAPTVVAATSMIGAPTATASADGAPASIASTSTIYAPSGQITLTPATIVAAGAVSVASVSAAAVATPAVVAAAGTVLSPSAAITAEPATIAATSAVGALAVTTSATAALDPAVATSTVTTPGISTGADSTAAPATITATSSVETSTVTASATVDLTAVSATSTVEAPASTGSATATAFLVESTAAVYAPAASTDATAATAAIAADFAVPAPTTTASATATAATVDAGSTVHLPAASEVTTAPAATVAATSTVTNPATTSSATAAPVTVHAPSAVPSPLVATSATATAAVIAATSTVTAPIVTAAPAVIARTATVQQPSVLSSSGAPTLRATPTTGTTASTQTSHTVIKPPGTTDGDLLITVFGVDAAGFANTINTPAGWTRLSQLRPGEVVGAVDYRVAASEPASTTWTVTTAERAAWIAMAIPGANGLNASATTIAEPASSMDFPTVTTNADNCLILYLAVIDYGNDVTFAADPEGCTLIGLSAVTSGARVIGWYETKATAGTTTPRQALGSASETTALWTIAISPAGVGGTSATAAVPGIAALASVPAPTVVSIQGEVGWAGVVSAVATVGAPAVQATATITAPVVTATSAVGTPTVSTSVTAAPGGTTATSTVGTPAPAGTANAQLTTIGGAAALGLPTISASSTATPGSTTGTGQLPVPATSSSATASPAGVATATLIHAPTPIILVTAPAGVIAAVGELHLPAVLTQSFVWLWNGTAWVRAIVHRWDGAAWQPAAMRVWGGSGWMP